MLWASVDLDADQAEPVVPLLESVAQVGRSIAQVDHSVAQVDHSVAQVVLVVSAGTADPEWPGDTQAEIDQEKSVGILRFGSCSEMIEFIYTRRQFMNIIIANKSDPCI